MSNATKQSEVKDLYKDLVLDHARTPRNFRKITQATHTAEGINPLCGDKLHVYLVVDDKDCVADMSFEGSGCAISVASASLMTDVVKNLSTRDADACCEAIISRLSGASSPADDTPARPQLLKLRALDGVREYPTRVKCASLAWHTLHAAMHKPSETATSE